MMKFFKTIILKIMTLFLFTISLRLYRLNNKNHNMTIISRDCIGGVIYNQYGLKFLSPTINLFMSMPDFNYFCLYLKEYIECDLSEIDNTLGYPLGELKPHNKKLPSIKIHFMHYINFIEAKEKWEKRKQLINWDKIYVINSCAYDREISETNKNVINLFNSIPYKKIIFIRYHMGFDDEIIIKPKKEYHVPYLLDKKRFSWKRRLNDYNLNKFFNANRDAF